MLILMIEWVPYCSIHASVKLCKDRAATRQVTGFILGSLSMDTLLCYHNHTSKSSDVGARSKEQISANLGSGDRVGC